MASKKFSCLIGILLACTMAVDVGVLAGAVPDQPNFDDSGNTNAQPKLSDLGRH